MRRRDFLSASTLALGVAVPGVGMAGTIPAAKNILDYGAKPDGKTLNTKAIQRAIDEVFRAGGGLVYVPPGTFLIGGLELKSRVTLYLEAGSVLLGSTSISDFDYHPGPPVKGDSNGHHVIFARDADDVTLCGMGTIDGQGPAYWRNVNRKPVAPEDMWQDAATWDFLPKDNLRPSPMIEFAQCRNLRISGITIRNAPGWTLRPVACETVLIDGIRIRNANIGPNTDGLDITACRNVMVSNCDIATGDDAICLKSQNPYGDLLPTKNITVTNCVITTTCNGFKFGTATQGAFENITFSNSVIYNEDASPLNTHVLGGVSLEAVDGGSIDGVLVSNIRMQNVRSPIFIRLNARRKRETPSFIRNIQIEGIDATGSVSPSSITGIPGMRPHDITVRDCRFRTIAEGKAEWASRAIPEVENGYPEFRMFGHLPSYGMYVRHVDKVQMRNLEFIADKPDARPAVVCDDVNDAVFSGIEASAPTGEAPVFDLRNTKRAFFTGMRSPEGAKVLAQISGAGSTGVEFAGNAFAAEDPRLRYVDGAKASMVKGE
jgi:polygalacturonase